MSRSVSPSGLIVGIVHIRNSFSGVISAAFIIFPIILMKHLFRAFLFAFEYSMCSSFSTGCDFLVWFAQFHFLFLVLDVFSVLSFF